MHVRWVKIGNFPQITCCNSKTSTVASLVNLHRVSKNAPPLTCYSLHIHNLITIIFGRSVTEKVRNPMMLCFPISPLLCFCITWQNRKPRRQLAGALCVQHSPTPVALSTSFLLNHAPSNSPAVWTHRLRDLGSHTASWVWVVSQKDWRNQTSGWIQAMHWIWVKMRCLFFRFTR